MTFNEKIIEFAQKDFGPLDDGFIYYFPNGYGGLSANTLRVIADELDRRNKELSDDIDDYFATHPPVECDDINFP